jgi:hypothetical protein
MRKLPLLLFMLLGVALAQPNNPQIQFVTATPSGACGNTQIRLLTPNGTFYTCQSGTWGAISGGGGAVSSVFSRTGAVVATSGDYTVGQVTNAASVLNPLSQFASTTSAQLLGILSNPTGTGLAVFNNTPTLITPVIGVATGTSLTVTGALTSGSGSGVAGALDLGQGTLPVLGTTAVSLLAPASVTSYGLLYPGAAPSANNFLLWGSPSSGISTGVFTGFTSTNLADTANLVRNQGTNTGTSAMTLDMSAATAAASLKLPTDASYVNNDCAKLVSSGGKFNIADAGAACGTGSGATGTSVTSVTPVTVSANSTSEQQLIELTLGSGYFNSLRQPFLFNGAGVYTTPIGQTPTLTFKVKLCTVSGCGSGTVVTLASIASTATLANSTNNTWNVNFLGYTSATGTTGNLEIHGPLTVDLGSLSTSPDSVFNDTNTAVSSNIDLTASLFVDFTVTTSTGSTSNSITQRSGGVMPFAATAAPVTSVNGSTGTVSISGLSYCADATGSTTTYTCPSASFCPTSLTTGAQFIFVPQASNTGASTVAWCGFTAKSVIAANTTGSALVASDIIAGGVYVLEYDGTALRKISGPDTTWTGLSYSNGWGDFGSGNQVGQFKKDNFGNVCIRGLLSLGTLTAGTTMATLPGGYRPASVQVAFAYDTRTGAAGGVDEFNITTAGVFQYEGSTSAATALFINGNTCFSVY